MRRLLGLAPLLIAVACAQDSGAPVPQPDTTIFGRIAAVRDSADAPGSVEIDVKTGLPESLQAVMRAEGRYVPEMERDLIARALVTPETVCVAGLEAGDLEAFKAGQEVAILPVQGTTTMTGTSLLRFTAAEMYLFSAYELRYMPRALPAIPAEVLAPADPARVNSAGLERSPIPLSGGRVLYFAAGLLPEVVPGGPPRGALRPGMAEGEARAPWAVGGVRPYRTSWKGGAWEPPAPVELPGLDPKVSARVTWVDEAETRCLVELTDAEGAVSLHESRRASASQPWGPLETVPEVKAAVAGDAQRFGKDGTSLVWTVFTDGGSDLWLSMKGAEGQALEPRINTPGMEWSPRVGPGTSLYFCRADRPLLFAGGAVQEVRLGTRQRRMLLEPAPTADGALLFYRLPRYTPRELDWNLAVSRKQGDGWSAPVPVDELRF